MTIGDEFAAAGPATFSSHKGTVPGTQVLVVEGEVDVATAPELRQELHRLLDEDTTTLVVDLSGTSFMDSSGLGVLIGALKRLRSDGHDDVLVLEGLQDAVRRVFEITGLIDVFTIRD